MRMMRFLRLLLIGSIALPGALAAQDPEGVRLGLLYQPEYQPGLVVLPFEASGGAAPTGASVQGIIAQDLEYSDRFQLRSMTEGAGSDESLNLALWKERGADWVLQGALAPRSGGLTLNLTLHDAVYGRVKDQRAIALPPPGDPNFRMAVHAISDAIVERITGAPGMAASSIAFIRRTSGRYELMLVDYDGENLRRISASDEILLSPAWSSNGRTMAYSVVSDEGRYQVQERVLATGEVHVLVDRPGLNITPSYAPSGDVVAFAIAAGSGTDIYSYDVRRRCCLTRLEGGRGRQLSPTYSPDGRRLAFNSDRLGQPHIYVMPADGGESELISPFVYGEPGYYTSPDWSPTGSLVAFHGRSRGNFQIMVADADSPGALVRQVTADGVSEDPSWAPDGRHLVFSGWRDSGRGLFVIDSSTGRLRPVVLGGDLLVPDWSPTLVRASDLMLDGR